jgi:hypothetical protein
MPWPHARLPQRVVVFLHCFLKNISTKEDHIAHGNCFLTRASKQKLMKNAQHSFLLANKSPTEGRIAHSTCFKQGCPNKN